MRKGKVLMGAALTTPMLSLMGYGFYITIMQNPLALLTVLMAVSCVFGIILIVDGMN
ncbi:hypothetical protein [Kushneria phosphatilytica]|uniref:hypothetical protein n=1 Tax=Kushneria phosphatilytica TaxID=657387 RepID=UPI00143BE6E4|nr:hypothetical protein [Kushneria phosphatilytica]